MITVQELNTLHTVCELGRNQLLLILAMSAQNAQLAGFLLTGNRKIFKMLKIPLHGFMIVYIFFHHYAELIVVLIVFFYISKIPFVC